MAKGTGGVPLRLPLAKSCTSYRPMGEKSTIHLSGNHQFPPLPLNLYMNESRPEQGIKHNAVHAGRISIAMQHTRQGHSTRVVVA